MIGLVRRLDRPVSAIRVGIEVAVLVMGYLLGGPVGVGTFVTPLTTGYAVQLAFRFGGYDKNAKHTDLWELIGAPCGKRLYALDEKKLEDREGLDVPRIVGDELVPVLGDDRGV
jgi:hypothetical protein